MTLPPFPVDDSALDLLERAVGIDDGAERSSLYDLLDLYSQLGGSDLSAVEEERDDVVVGRVLVMRDPCYSVGDVVGALVAEVRRLRGQ